MWSTGEGNGKPLQYSCLENPMNIMKKQNDRTPVFLGFLVAQTVKNLPAMWETWVQSLGWKDPLEKGMAARSSILAWRIP